MTTFFINTLGFGILISGIFSITSKNPVISVIFLIATFVLSSLYLIFIGINFIGISYIVIYVGAIAVLFLFIIMMINIKLTEILEVGNEYTKNLPLAFVIGLLFIFIILNIIPFNFNNIPILTFLLDNITYLNSLLIDSNLIFTNLNNSIGETNLLNDSNLIKFQQIEILGFSLYTLEAVLFIILSLILLLAMLAIISLSRFK